MDESNLPPDPPRADKKVNQKTLIFGAAGGLLVVMVLIYLFSGKSDGYDEDLMKTNPAQALVNMARALHPDWQVQATDDSKSTVTMIDKASGKPVSFRFDPGTKTLVVIAEEVKPAAPAAAPSTADPKSGVATWVPVYPGTTPEITSSAQTAADGDQSIFTFKTTDPPTKVINFYKDELQKAGFKITLATAGETTGQLSAEDGLQKKSIIMTAQNDINDEGKTVGTKARAVVVEKK